ncbi:hypothetical protein JTB14_010069 [Gonioctena quinquepunctata]|nr:hypothetical protein JTB14_010069 [Gonioctena quinquepunctata]
MLHAGGAISWFSQRQAMVATSTTEAEIVAPNEATKEIIWLSRLFEEIIGLKHVPILQVDNSAAMRLAQNPEFHRRTKHKYFNQIFLHTREDLRRKLGCSTNTHRRTDRRHDDEEFTKTTSSNIMQSNRNAVILDS